MSLSWLRQHARHRNRGTIRLRCSKKRFTAQRAQSNLDGIETYVPRVTYDNSFVVDSSVTFQDAKWVSDDQYIRQYHRLGWEVVPIRKDGNCLFRALSNQLYGHERRHLELRRRLVDFIDLKRAFFEPFVTKEGVVKYCARLREAGASGGHLELIAASKLLGIKIIVHTGPVMRLQFDCDESAEGREGKGQTVNLLLRHDHYSSLRKKESSHEQLHGCSETCLCKRIVMPSRASLEARASLNECPSNHGLISSNRNLDMTQRNSVKGRPPDIAAVQRGRLKGAYGRKPVPDAPNSSSSSLKSQQSEILIKPKSRPPPPQNTKPPAPEPPSSLVAVEPTPLPTPSAQAKSQAPIKAAKQKIALSSSRSAPRILQKSPGVVLFQPESLKSTVEVKTPLVVLFEPDQSSSKLASSKKLTATPENFTAIAAKENKAGIISRRHDTVSPNTIRRPRRAVFNGGKRRRSSVAALTLRQEVSVSLSVSATEVTTEPYIKPVDAVVEPVVASVEPESEVSIINHIKAAKPTIPTAHVVIKKSSKKVFRQGRPVPAAC
ncbi:OTU (ovarian tumor)-like cysteine protease [Plasmopara halstedii]|uniref:OTU (Ovarian tumor)-like cysteine protease n=1 Tax=Plasmopara halstedii TaxID=4781 RepID=A0A0P1AEH7_PLAHL|nr:OTU (ovarian tumor)-like cysteine protease [Plasmopara halstedii]CEG39200.1 OTU (ovarian tumor)-like cysteine protease [Plasmopara halstedii]|eukprot:XP_024575569.1 OTU (ovarian tumor)-like cysteine protease [Plasmopara halstedii]